MPLKAEGTSFGICGYDKYKASEMIRQHGLTKLDFGLMYALGIHEHANLVQNTKDLTTGTSIYFPISGGSKLPFAKHVGAF